MLVNTTADVVRLVGGLVRLADGRLVRTAARNAAGSVDALKGRALDDARTLRDLSRIPAARRPEHARPERTLPVRTADRVG